MEQFDGTLEDLSELYAEGNLLVSARNIDSILILDGDTHEILWLWGPNNIGRQHHPRLLENGRILVFDNGLAESRVLEVDVHFGEVQWVYEKGASFFSQWGGGNQRLPNGNTLITESATGHVFEVTPEGERVWEFANPNFNKTGKQRRNIWRMTRIDPADLEFLD